MFGHGHTRRVGSGEAARARRRGLYEPAFEHDACGVGFLASLGGLPHPSVLPLALTALGRMAHRGAVDADGTTGDGAGVTTQIPYALLQEEGMVEAEGGLATAAPAVGLLFLPPD